MKLLFTAVIIALLSSCSNSNDSNHVLIPIELKKADSGHVLIIEKKYVDSVKFEMDSTRLAHKEDSLFSLLGYLIDSVKHSNDSLQRKLFLANYKLEKIKFYIRICMRKPSQDKFLKGWIRRVVE